MKNKNLLINQTIEADVKKIAKSLNKFLNIYAYKSAYLNNEIKNIKHTEYLNIVSRLCGYSDFNEYNKKNKIKKVEAEKFIHKLKHFLSNLNNDSPYYKGDIDQIAESFYFYISYTDSEISKNISSIKAKITRRINRAKKELDDIYKIGEYERLLKIITNKYFSTIIIDYKSILNYNSENKYTKEVRELLFEYYLFRNVMTIKLYQKNKIFPDIIGKHIYLFEDLLIDRKYDEYLPFEYFEFLADQYKYFHGGFNNSKYRILINDFKRIATEKAIGKNALVKAIFKTVNEDGLIFRKTDITRNKDNQWSIIELTLANNDKFEMHIYKDGDIYLVKDFDDNEFASILIYSYKEDISLRWTIPEVERNGRTKERFPFFYPKNKDDKFIFKTVFEDGGYNKLYINQFGILKNNSDDIDITFREIMEMLYYERIEDLLEKEDKNDDDFKEIETYLNKIKTDYSDS